ncbi:MAG: hypothetical protein GY862_15215 [Gammaproteobacteria bacterium]|nr:hypothetical protein [Gammaproteobacteria bacterium]
MSNALTLDRPGWIPPEITHDWDTCPYAYQTEEELMPGGGPHGGLRVYIMNILRVTLEKRNLMLLMDSFMLYRDESGVKRRVSPDLLLMPWRSSEPDAYDLEIERPPLCLKDLLANTISKSEAQKHKFRYTTH